MNSNFILRAYAKSVYLFQLFNFVARFWHILALRLRACSSDPCHGDWTHNSSVA